jgi:hypothetical protein
MVAVWAGVNQQAGLLACICGSFNFTSAHCLTRFAFLLPYQTCSTSSTIMLYEDIV